MKQCSTCNRTYDDSLKFCLSDGTPLFVVVQAPPSQPQPVAAVTRHSIPPLLYVVLAGVLLLIGGAAATLFIYKSNILAISRNETPVNAPGVSAQQPNNGSQPAGTVTNSLSGMSKSSDSLPESRPAVPVADAEQIKRKISDRIYNWKQTAEARDLRLYMQNYAETVDYYRKTAASKSFVRSDKQRAFSKFSSIALTIDIVSVDADPGGGLANAMIDKEWLFQGGGYSAGKVRQRLQFRLMNGEWLIAGEKDLKVYYVNS